MINRNNIFCRIANTFRLSKILFVDESCRHFQESSLLDIFGRTELCLNRHDASAMFLALERFSRILFRIFLKFTYFYRTFVAILS